MHRFYTNRAQINGGKLDRYVLFSDAAGLTLGYYSAAAMESTHLWRLAKANTLLDNFFQGTFGGSFLNHFWLICACAPTWPNPPADQRSQLDGAGNPLAGKDKRVVATMDGDFVVNSTQSSLVNDRRQGRNLLPPQTMITIGDRLSEKGIDWAWYAGA